MAIAGINSLILTIIFFFAGLQYATYIGATLFLYYGFRHSRFKGSNTQSIMSFLLSVFLFVMVVIIYYNYKLSNADSIVFPPLQGFIYLILPFVIFFTVGWLVSLIRIKGLDLLVYFSIMGLIVCATINHYSQSISGSLTGVFYFYFAYRLFSINRLKWYYNYMVLSFTYLIVFFFLGDLHQLTIVNYLFISFAVIAAYFFVKLKSVGGAIVGKKQKGILISFLFASLAYYFFLLNFTEYIRHKDCKLPDNKKFNEVFFDMSGNKVLSSDFKGKIVVLDLWSTSCNVCFRKFHEFEKFYNSNRDKIVIYAVGLKLRSQDNTDLKKVIEKQDYDFPFLIAERGFDYYRNRYSINGVPSVLILDTDGNIVYNNVLNTNPLIRINNLQMMVDKLLKEHGH